MTEINATERIRRARSPELYRLSDRMSYARNAEKKAAQAKARRARDREMYNASVRERRKQHPEKHRAVAANRRQKERTGTITAADIRRQLEAQGFRWGIIYMSIVDNGSVLRYH